MTQAPTQAIAQLRSQNQHQHQAQTPAPNRDTRTTGQDEAIAISRVTAIVAGLLVAIGGALAGLDLLQASGLALFAALVSSIASVAGRPSRGARWVAPIVVGSAMLTVVVVSLIHR